MKIKLLATAVLAGMALVACSDTPSRTSTNDRVYQNDNCVDSYYATNHYASNTVNKTKVKPKSKQVANNSGAIKKVSLTKTKRQSVNKAHSTRTNSSKRR